MEEISFKKGTEGYVAEYTSEGRTMVQIQGVRSGRISVSQFIDGMEPCLMKTENFSNTVMEINVPAGMKVRLVSDVEVKAVKSIVIKEAASAAGGGGGESYVLVKATDSALGGVKTGHADTETQFGLKLDSSDKAYVEVPKAGASKYGMVKQGAHVSDATGQTDAHTVVNDLIDKLESAGILASA